MFKVIRKQVLTPTVKRIDILSPDIAHKWQPGQFVIIMPDPRSRRIALNSVDVDPSRDVVSITFSETDSSTERLGSLRIGDEIFALMGPLGKALKVPKKEKMVMISDDVQIASILPICEKFRKEGKNKVGVIAQFDSFKQVIFESHVRRAANKFTIVTREKSYYETRQLTDVFQDILKTDAVQRVYMNARFETIRHIQPLLKKNKIPTWINLLHPCFGHVNVFDDTEFLYGKKSQFISIEDNYININDVNLSAVESRVESCKEFASCPKAQYPRRVSPNASGIFPKLFAGLVGAKR